MENKILIVERVDKSIPMPKYATPQSAGIDLLVRERTIVPCNPFPVAVQKAMCAVLDATINVGGGCYQEAKELIKGLTETYAHKRTMVPLNLKVEYPRDRWGILVARGGLYKEKGIVMSNGFGTIDLDFCKEHWFPAINLTNHDVVLEAGEAIAQLIFVPFEQFNLLDGYVEQHEKHNGESSTGGYKIVYADTTKE